MSNAAMLRPGAIVRLLMLVVCLVPFSSPRQAAAALAPSSPAPAPASPTSEEDDSEREELQAAGAKDKLKPRAAHPPVAHSAAEHPPFTLSDPAPPRPQACPSPADPFRNGLYSPGCSS